MKALLLIPFFIFCSCKNNCSSGLDIKISSQLRSKQNYCLLLRQTLDGNRVSFKQFTQIINDGSYAYEHGIILVHVINEVGYEELLPIVEQMSNSEISLLRSYLIAGEEYGDAELHHRERIFKALEF